MRFKYVYTILTLVLAGILILLAATSLAVASAGGSNNSTMSSLVECSSNNPNPIIYPYPYACNFVPMTVNYTQFFMGLMGK